MAVQAQTLRPYALNAHFFRDFVGFLPARHLAKSLEMMRAFPGLGLLLVTFGTGIRTDDLGQLGRNRAARGKADDDQKAAQTKYGNPKRGAWLELDRAKAMPSKNDNDSSLLLQPFDTPGLAVAAGRGRDRKRARPAADWLSRRAAR